MSQFAKDNNTFSASWQLYDAERMANERLRQQLADSEAERLEQARLLGMSGEREARLLAEIERLKGECLSFAIEATPGIQLAAAQAREQRLRDAIGKAKEGLVQWHVPENRYTALDAINGALALPQDTSALDQLKAQVAREAGEVMRERCAKELLPAVTQRMTPPFRALPGVTLEDLK